MTKEEIQYEAQSIIQEWGSNDSAPYVEFVEKLASMELPESLSNLDEAAEKYSENILANNEDLQDAIEDAFKAGAEWMAGQGYTREGIARPDDCEIWVNLTDTDIKDGNKVIVQIRKK